MDNSDWKSDLRDKIAQVVIENLPNDSTFEELNEVLEEVSEIIGNEYLLREFAKNRQ